MKGLIHHIEIYVSNLEKTIEFWSWLLLPLGYETYPFENGISYKFKDSYIVFVQTEEKYSDIQYHRKRTGLNHLAFHLDTRTEVDEYYIKLKERNVSILYEDKHPFAGGKDYYAVFFEDPDRIKVEFVAYQK